MQIDLSRVNATTDVIIGAAIKVHRGLGPGLLESVYLACLTYELRKANLEPKTQVRVPVRYEEVRIDCGLRLDIVVSDLVVVEVKSVRRLARIHDAQVLTYLKLSGYPVALLINFNVPQLKKGLKRLLNAHPAERFLVSREPPAT